MAVLTAAGRVGQYAAAAARVPVQRLVPGRRHDAHTVDRSAGASGPVGRAAGGAHCPSPVVQQHGTVEVVVPVVRRRHAAAADAQSAAPDARLVRVSAAHAAAAAVVVGRPGTRPDRPAAHRAVPLSTAAATRSRRIRPGRRPVDRGQLGGYAPGAAGRARSRGAQRRPRPVRFPGRHVAVTVAHESLCVPAGCSTTWVGGGSMGSAHTVTRGRRAGAAGAAGGAAASRPSSAHSHSYTAN